MKAIEDGTDEGKGFIGWFENVWSMAEAVASCLLFCRKE